MPTPSAPDFLASLIETLAGTWPAAATEQDTGAAAATALATLEPRDLIETMLAARMIAAHHASLEGYRRAMQPDTADIDTVRLRASARAAGLDFDAALRSLQQHRAPAPHTQAHGAEHPPPKNPLADFTPDEIAAAEYALDNDPANLERNELAKRIPLYRWEDMTMEERRVAYKPAAPLTPAMIAVLGERLAEANNRPLPPGYDGS